MEQSLFTSAKVDLEMLSERLFITGDYPSIAHINAYNRSKLLTIIAESLKTISQLDTLENWCLGKLFTLTPAELIFFGKLVLNFLGRQLIPRKLYEFWFVFAGKPLKFSLHEFSHVTGLPCGQFPDQLKIEKITATEEGCEPICDVLYGKDSSPLIDDLVDMLRDKTKELDG